jgi:hypothetical protein
VPVLDGSIVQLRIRWYCTSGAGIFLADAAKILLGVSSLIVIFHHWVDGTLGR